SFVMVDIPGLIEGAHKGVGLGHEFLRHVERTRVLVHLLDGLALNPLDDFRKVNEELRLYSEDLTRKPQLVAINKIDIPEVRELAGDMRAALSGETDAPVFLVSAATGEGVDALLNRALQVLEAERGKAEVVPRSEKEAGELPVLRPRPRRESVTVSVDSDGAYVVHSPMASRIAAMIDASDWDASLQFYRYMRDIGVTRALEEAGVSPGDTVRIGKVEFEWE
ncbi:MAG: Obg family GTPase CgtA, partial [Chloroflexi bacterium]|nr:Obg family GTPase CgtA [Chloroflexota bacterium]